MSKKKGYDGLARENKIFEVQIIDLNFKITALEKEIKELEYYKFLFDGCPSCKRVDKAIKETRGEDY